MDREIVTSKDLRTVGYDPSSLTLEVEFHNGAIYQYYAVPPEVYDAMMSSSSQGQFFHSDIKRQFRYSRLQ